MKKILISIVAFFVFTSSVNAQKDTKVSFEQVKEQCKNLPLEKRVRITVARFSVTTTAPNSYGGNLATMLTNALQGVNCYSVLESLINKSDMNDEIDYGEGGYSKKTTTPKKGKQLGPQVVITGEITEYNVKNTGVRVGLIKVGNNKAKIGFVLKVLNPETREIIYSQSINVESKTGGSTEFGAFGLNVVNTEMNDPAVANATEQGIVKAVEFLASKKDSLSARFPIASGATNSNTISETEISLSNANFTNFNALSTILNSLIAFKSMEKSLKSGVGTFTISHTGNTEKLLEELNKKLVNKYEVIGFEEGKIELKAK